MGHAGHIVSRSKPDLAFPRFQATPIILMTCFILMTLFFLFTPERSFAMSSGEAGDPDNGTGASEGSANGGGFNGGSDHARGAVAVCEPQNTKVTECETEVFHPITLRCVPKEVLDHPNGFFYTEKGLCIPSNEGAKTHCTDMPAWDGCSDEKKLKKIEFKIPDAFTRCTDPKLLAPASTAANLTQEQSLLEAEKARCKCQNDAIDSILNKIKDHPVDKDGNIANQIDGALRASQQCASLGNNNPNLTCLGEGCSTTPSTTTGLDGVESSKIGIDPYAGGGFAMSRDPKDRSGISRSPAGDGSGITGVSLAGGGLGASNVTESPAAQASMPADEEFLYNMAGGIKNSTGSSSSGGGKSGGESIYNFGGGAKGSSVSGSGSESEGMSEEIKAAMGKRGITSRTIFEIVSSQYRKQAFDLDTGAKKGKAGGAQPTPDVPNPLMGLEAFPDL